MHRLCGLALAAAVFSSFLLTACGDDDGPPTDAGPLADGEMPDRWLPDGAMPDGGAVPECWVPEGVEPTVTACPGEADRPAPPATGTCTVTAGTGDALLIRGDVLTPGEVLRWGQVLVDGSGAITCVGCDCTGEAGASTATEVSCPAGVISPGLINPHEHITFQAPPATITTERYEHRHDWRTGHDGHTEITSGGSTSGAGVAWGELRHLLGGATSVNGSGTGTGLLRNLDRASAIGDIGGAESDVYYDTFPLGDSSGTERLDCSYPDTRRTNADIAGEDAYTPHISEGIEESAHNEFVCSVMDGAFDLIEPQTAMIHGIGMTAFDIGAVAAQGSSLVWSPRSNIALYGDTARVPTYATMGVRIALGTDWLRSGSMNMLRELACADELNTTYFNGYFTDEQLWLMATLYAAEALDVETSIGVLAPGRRADITIFDGSVRGDHRAVIGATSADVALVLRSGDPLYGDAELVAALTSASCDLLSDVCGSQKRVCVGDSTFSLAEILAAGPTYDAFSCGVPPNEPTCVPFRNSDSPEAAIMGSTEYTGDPVDGDVDGDGVPDAEDNCRCTFNPVRPMDDGAQADFDGDGWGDECDPCPTSDTGFACVPPDPNDSDGDGVPNAEDNCPGVANEDQADGDGDDKGDVCDPCPADANPGAAACPGTIYEVRDGTFAVGTAVGVSGAIVTAVGPDGFYMQVDPSSAGHTGPDFSGVFVYTADAPAVARGDVVDVSGEVADFFGLAQLVASTVAVTGTAAVPAPVAVEPAVIATGGARAEALESVLVRVETVTVADPALGFGEFSLDAGLRVDDALYLVDPWPSAGEMLSYVQGPLSFSFSNTKILPRDAADVVFSSLRLAPGDIRVEPSGTVTLTVLLPTPAPVGGAAVAIAAAPVGLLTGPAVITVPEGLQTASADYVASATEISGTVTAAYGAETAMANVTVAAAPRLLFSEYVEGNSFNKALEIANVGGSAADLGVCTLRRYTNGSTSPTNISLSGALASGDVHVVCHTDIDASAASLCDLTSGSLTHNGDDAYDLFCAGVVVDTFGRIGEDPGTAWSGGGLSTMDNVLTRQCSVTTGDPDGTDAFDPSVEWTGSAWVDPASSFAGLGNRSECP